MKTMSGGLGWGEGLAPDLGSIQGFLLAVFLQTLSTFTVPKAGTSAGGDDRKPCTQS